LFEGSYKRQEVEIREYFAGYNGFSKESRYFLFWENPILSKGDGLSFPWFIDYENGVICLPPNVS